MPQIHAEQGWRAASNCRLPLQETQILSGSHAIATPKLALGTTTSTIVLDMQRILEKREEGRSVTAGSSANTYDGPDLARHESTL